MISDGGTLLIDAAGMICLCFLCYREGNCANVLRLAEEHLSIPDVLTAANLSSPDLDELSGMTYLSYFMAENSPGYKATLDFVLLQISPTPVTNFQVSKQW